MKMTFTDTLRSNTASLIKPEELHRSAATQLEKAAKHHRQAALLHDMGDARQADTHANIAHISATKALGDSERALRVTLW
jgi:hypothetical protein